MLIRQKVEHFFAQVQTYQEVTLRNLLAFVGIDQISLLHVFSRVQLKGLRDAWTREHLRKAMDDLCQHPIVQSDFSALRVATHAGVCESVLYHFAKEEFQRRRTALPTAREKVLSALESLVEADTPLTEFSRERILATAGVTMQENSWFKQVRRAATLELARRHQPLSGGEGPPSQGSLLVGGIWVDVESDCWDLPRAGGGRRRLRRDRLRDDFADVAWSLLQADVRSGEVEVGTVVSHYTGFINAGEVLGTALPDLRFASLEALQRAWLRYDGVLSQRRGARRALLRLVEALIASRKGTDNSADKELLRIAAWLGSVVTVPTSKPGEGFLSEDALTALLQGCLAEIKSGIAFTEDEPNLAIMSTLPEVRDSAAPVVNWAVALMVVLMAFTGLRRQSVVLLTIHDWIQIRPGLFAVVWRHGKKREEKLAVLPPAIASHLDVYVQRTASLRAAIGTERLFLNGWMRRSWGVMSEDACTHHLNDLAKRHHLGRDDAPLRLGSTILRRTFTTRALAEGQSIWAISSQLGHSRILTTFLYSKHDRFTHPSQVSGPLDTYGRQSLSLWSTPLLLDDLDATERARLLEVQDQRQQDTGLCRHDHCVKATTGGPPPCSLCEHLVTGIEFLDAWEHEQAEREEELQRLAQTPHAGLVLAQMKGQFEHFQENFAFLQRRCGL